MANITWWCQEIIEIMCMFEKELPVSFMDMYAHILTHLPNEVELDGWSHVIGCYSYRGT